MSHRKLFVAAASGLRHRRRHRCGASPRRRLESAAGREVPRRPAARLVRVAAGAIEGRPLRVVPHGHAVPARASGVAEAPEGTAADDVRNGAARIGCARTPVRSRRAHCSGSRRSLPRCCSRRAMLLSRPTFDQLWALQKKDGKLRGGWQVVRGQSRAVGDAATVRVRRVACRPRDRLRAGRTSGTWSRFGALEDYLRERRCRAVRCMCGIAMLWASTKLPSIMPAADAAGDHSTRF